MCLNTYSRSQDVFFIKLQYLFTWRVSYMLIFWELLSVMNHGPQTCRSRPCSKRGGQSLNKPLPLSVISVLGSACTFPVQTISTLFFLYRCYFYCSYFSWTRSVVDTIRAKSDIRGLSFLKLFTVATGAAYISISVTANSTVPWIARLGEDWPETVKNCCPAAEYV